MAASELTSEQESTPCLLRVAATKQGTTSAIELEGEWDLNQCDPPRAAVAQALAQRPECLVIDLSRLSFIDLSGVHALFETCKRCAEQKTRLVIIPGPRAVQRVLEISGLAEILPLAPPEAYSGPGHPLLSDGAEPGESPLRSQRLPRSIELASNGSSPPRGSALKRTSAE